MCSQCLPTQVVAVYVVGYILKTALLTCHCVFTVSANTGSVCCGFKDSPTHLSLCVQCLPTPVVAVYVVGLKTVLLTCHCVFTVSANTGSGSVCCGYKDSPTYLSLCVHSVCQHR